MTKKQILTAREHSINDLLEKEKQSSEKKHSAALITQLFKMLGV